MTGLTEVSALRIDGDPEERRLKWSAPRQIFLSSYETLRNDVSFACRNIWDVIILDEAQKIKNRNAAVSRICKRLPRTQAWALTGTPLENCEDDLASVLEFVRENPGGDQLPPLRPGYRLREMQENFQLRRRKKDVLKDLPPRMLIRVPLELTASQRQAYTIMKQRGTEQLVQLGRKATVINVLELITRLKQICNFCPETGSSVKADDLHHRLKSLRGSGHRALIFSQWTSEHFGTGRLEKELKEFRPLAYTGTLLQAERAARIEMFKRDTQHTALILSLRAGGQGLNLQEATYVFHFDRWWNPAVENQASDRAHRMGQKHAVTVYAYTCIDTIEERIEQILESKRALFAALVDQVSLDVRKLLSAEELFGLFGLTAPVGLVTKKSSGQAADLLNRLQLLLRHNGWTRYLLRPELHPFMHGAMMKLVRKKSLRSNVSPDGTMGCSKKGLMPGISLCARNTFPKKPEGKQEHRVSPCLMTKGSAASRKPRGSPVNSGACVIACDAACVTYRCSAGRGLPGRRRHDPHARYTESAEIPGKT